MRIQWDITLEDARRASAVITANRKTELVLDRRRRNLVAEKPEVTRERLWKAMICMRMTTQQKSGPGTPVSRFQRTEPFPLGYERTLEQPSIERFVTTTLRAAGGIRFADKIGLESATNLNTLEAGGWAPVLERCNQLRGLVDETVEREISRYIASKFVGFGPKQSRNVLQALGLTRFEIPIDSRIIAWLNEFGFPIKLSATALSDENYYVFVSSGIQALCQAIGEFPCVLDAAIFAAVDGAAGSETEAIF